MAINIWMDDVSVILWEFSDDVLTVFE